jgi:hypothetical protein
MKGERFPENWARLSYSLAQERLGLPLVVADGCGFAVAACCTSFVAYVVCASAAASAHDVDGFALALAL